MVKPGKLTRDYLEGRRARFMPPFRTYLVLSIFFFLIAFFDPREELGILFEPEAAAETTEATEEAASNAEDIRQEVMERLLEEGVITPEQAEEMLQDESPGGVNFTFNDNRVSADSDCEDIDSEEIPAWARSRLSAGTN